MMEKISLADFRDSVKSQGVAIEDVAFICPMCRTVQSARDLIEAGAGDDFEAVEEFLGFSCVGRWTDAGGPRKEPDGQPCNWTLGGLFRMHKLEVITEDGEAHPRFQLATPDEAKAHAVRAKEGEGTTS